MSLLGCGIDDYDVVAEESLNESKLSIEVDSVLAKRVRNAAVVDDDGGFLNQNFLILLTAAPGQGCLLEGDDGDYVVDVAHF